MTTIKEALAAKAAKEETKEAKIYMTSGSSRRGYQAATRIIRPDPAGVYTPKDEEETKLLDSLVAKGLLIIDGAAVEEIKEVKE